MAQQTYAYLTEATDADREGPGARWRLTREVPCVQACGTVDVVVQPADKDLRIYVNALPVVGRLQVLRRGDFVRIVAGDGTQTLFRFGGRPSFVREAGRGRPCSFTGEPVQGDVLRCANCDRLFSEGGAGRKGRCSCGNDLVRETEPEPPEELL